MIDSILKAIFDDIKQQVYIEQLYNLIYFKTKKYMIEI
jgi:hypothetical protein